MKTKIARDLGAPKLSRSQISRRSGLIKVCKVTHTKDRFREIADIQDPEHRSPKQSYIPADLCPIG